MKIIFKILNQLFKNDPVFNCQLYKDENAGSCVHVDGILCDYPKCEMLSLYLKGIK